MTTITVNRLDDITDGTDGQTTLREAITSASAGDTIVFATGGTITLTQGELLIDKNLTIDGDLNADNQADVTISANNASRVINIDGGAGAADVTLNGLTIRDGSVTGLNGGGVSLGSGDSLTLTNSAVQNNTSTSLFDDDTFQIVASKGGGIFADDGATLSISNTLISQNAAAPGLFEGFLVGGGDGGGLYVGAGDGTLGVTVTITGSEISSNSAQDTGGLVAREGTVTITNSLIANNSTEGSIAGVGGFFNSTLTFTNTTITGNVAAGGVGGVSTSESSNQIHYNSTITGNVGSTIAGVNALSQATFVNSIIAGNYLHDGQTLSEFGTSTADFSATFTSTGVNLFGTLTRQENGTSTINGTADDIVLGLDGSAAQNVAAGTTLADIFVATREIDPDGTPGSGDEFTTGALANNGGTVQTIAISEGGAAQNAGTDAELPVDSQDLDGDSNNTEVLPVDGRGTGSDRVSVGQSDLGAFEIQAATISGDATGALTEDDATTTATGQLTVSDPDGGDNTVQVQTNIAGTYGTFSITTNGAWIYTLDNSLAATNALTTGDEVTETFLITSTDGTATQNIVVSISGANQTPTAITPTIGNVNENALATTVATLSTVDADVSDTHTYQIISVTNAIRADVTGDALFSIGGQGLDELIAAANLDFELSGSYQVVVQTTDSHNATYQETLTININDILGQTFNGTPEIDEISGTGEQDTINGLASNDTLTGGAGADVLNGGEGTDTARYAGSVAAVRVDLAANAATGGDAEGDVFNSIENLIGSSHADQLTGNELANELSGGDGDDMLQGGDGDDMLRGGAGRDQLFGGVGNDTIFFDANDDMDNVQGGAGIDVLRVEGQPSPLTYVDTDFLFDLSGHGFESATIVQTDDTGGETWESITRYYDNGWLLNHIDTLNDDGSTTTLGTTSVTTLDTDNSQLWSSFTDYIDADSYRVRENVYNDTGDYLFYFWDVTGGQSWTEYSDFFNTAGQRTRENIYHDDGGYTFYNWDPSDQQEWSEFREDFNAAGQRTVQRVYDDSGDYTFQYWDVDETASWDTIFELYDDAGRFESRTTNDDGTLARTYYDVHNANEWATITDTYDAAGNLVSHIVVNDGGVDV